MNLAPEVEMRLCRRTIATPRLSSQKPVRDADGDQAKRCGFLVAERTRARLRHRAAINAARPTAGTGARDLFVAVDKGIASLCRTG